MRANVGHLALNAILTQKPSRKAGVRDASISTGSIYCVDLAVSAPGSQPDPSNVAAGCGIATSLPPGFGCSKSPLQHKESSARGAKVSQDSLTASHAAVPAVPTKDQCIPAMDQGIPARDQGISIKHPGSTIKDPGSTAEVKGSCTEDQGIPTEAQRILSEGQVVLMSQPCPAAVDCVVPATADDSSVAAGAGAHPGSVSPSSADQGIADWLIFGPLTDNLLWLGPFQPRRSPCWAASYTPQISMLGCFFNSTNPLVWLPFEPHQSLCLTAVSPHNPWFLLPLQTHHGPCRLAPLIATKLPNWSSNSLTSLQLCTPAHISMQSSQHGDKASSK